MPWLGFTFAKKPVASSAAPKKKPSASSAPSPSDVAEAFDDGFEAGTDEAPTVRMLRPEEIEKLQSENEQLKALIQQLSEKAKVQMQQPQAGVYPSVDGASSSSAASSSSTASPILTPSAPSAPSSFAFTKITDVHNVLSSPTPSAPPAELSASRRASSTGAIHSATALTPAELAPVSDFYDSLRKSLAASNSASSTSSSSPVIVPKPAKADADFEESEEDEWGAGEKTEKKPAAIVQESVNAPRTEDEAIVHNKHSSVIIRKKPIRQPKDEEAGSNTTTTAAAPKTTGGDLDDFDDDFGMMDTAAASSATALDEPEEEIAVFDVSQADWWYVVPHPDREGEELKSAPQPALDPAEDEDGFVLIKSKDSLTALGEFISSMMAQHPEIARLSPEQVRQMLEQSMVDRGLKEPTTMGKAWKYGMQMYNVWSYGAWGYSLYKDQTVLRLVAAGVIKAATWTMVFLI